MTADEASRAKSIEAAMTLGSFAEAMREHRTPAVSIAVIDDYQVAWAGAYGLRAAGEDDAVTTETLFQAASISKPVAATAILRLAQEGHFDLGAELNSLLSGWRVGTAEGVPAAVTVRQVLSHTGGLTVSGFPGYARGERVPTLLEVLDGLPPANTGPVRSFAPAPHEHVYSGGGSSILQLLVEELTGSFEAAVAGKVLASAGMFRSGYAQPAADEEVALAHDESGAPMPQRWNIHPELAAAGLWTTPTDLGRFGIAISHAFMGHDERLLSRETVSEALTPVTDANSPPFRWMGLGFRGAGEGRLRRVGHTGGNVGYRCILMVYPEVGCGAAIMTNSDNGAFLWADILRAIAQVWEWPRPTR